MLAAGPPDVAGLGADVGMYGSRFCIASSGIWESLEALDNEEVLRCEACDIVGLGREPPGDRRRGGGLKVLWLFIMKMSQSNDIRMRPSLLKGA